MYGLGLTPTPYTIVFWHGEISLGALLVSVLARQQLFLPRKYDSWRARAEENLPGKVAEEIAIRQK